MVDPFVGAASASLDTATTVNFVASLPRFRRLRHVLIRLRTQAQGPCIAGATVENRDQSIDSLLLKKRAVIRNGTLSSTTDQWIWHGDLPLPDNQNLIIFLRNDSGATVNWQANWLVE